MKAITSIAGSAPLRDDADEPIAAILKVLGEGERFLVCSHAGPDGDAVGSMLAMGMLLKRMGKHADMVSADRVPIVFRALPGADRIQTAMRVHGPYDAVILLECDGVERTRLQGLESFFHINIDHHASGVAFADLNWIDREAACVGEMVYRLFRSAGVALTPEAASCIYTTVLTDTGGFVYGGTRASTFELARELVAAGADPIRIAQQVYFSTPISKLLLLGAALKNLHREGRVAWLWISQEDMIRSCAVEEDCEGIVNYALSTAEVEVAAFLRELEEKRVRVSLRSKGRVNVAAIAGRLGGGGHENAAGCTLDGPLSRAKEQIVEELRAALACARERSEGRNLIA
ncbi:DHH family phosphoesterase [Occallatibacter savannae]|uniref:DHH family phosphoesterase n=1 Tax=Occallatibacter savannae TaxID=1002691 RepID=UPI000D69A11D|nr:bifunctional oligoribonuclease/PAP phosphatase NrnA [Occallatibacter savannae]